MFSPSFTGTTIIMSYLFVVILLNRECVLCTQSVGKITNTLANTQTAVCMYSYPLPSAMGRVPLLGWSACAAVSCGGSIACSVFDSTQGVGSMLKRRGFAPILLRARSSTAGGSDHYWSTPRPILLSLRTSIASPDVLRWSSSLFGGRRDTLGHGRVGVWGVCVASSYMN